jgi:GNAT superfamily N-acetyltransferase
MNRQITKVKNWFQFLAENHNSHNEYNNKLVVEFINHYYNGVELNINNIPKNLINKFPIEMNNSDYLYAGVDKNRKIKDIKSWTLDSETANSFSKKYNNGKVVELSYLDFIKQFNNFVSMDIIYYYIHKNGLGNEKTDTYISESEIVVLNNSKSHLIEVVSNKYVSLSESINIENPSTDEYNEIIVNGEKVGYIILSPARKEYYWVDVNLPNPLAIVDIKIFQQFRGKNYMKETMNWLYKFAKDNGYKSLFLRVDDDSEISQEILLQIYIKYGFSVYKTYDDDDDIFMYKSLY